jgi:hypothetical protein
MSNSLHAGLVEPAPTIDFVECVADFDSSLFEDEVIEACRADEFARCFVPYGKEEAARRGEALVNEAFGLLECVRHGCHHPLPHLFVHESLQLRGMRRHERFQAYVRVFERRSFHQTRQ